MELGLYLYSQTQQNVLDAVKAGISQDHAMIKASQVMTSWTILVSAALGLSPEECEELPEQIYAMYVQRCKTIASGESIQ